MIMENLRLHDSARTYGSNHLTNKLSVTALKRLLPVFLMMIFLGIGTDALGQQKNTLTETAIFTQDQLNIFDGKPITGQVSTLSSGDYITLSSSSANVQATINDPKGAQGTKVRPTGAFTITPMGGGAKITSITLITSRKDCQLTSSVTATETVDKTETNRTYTYSNATGDITFTNNNNNVNIYVSSITVNYTYTAAATQTQLVGTFANNIIGYEGDKGTAIPTLTVTAGSTTLKANEYTVEYSSSNPTAIEISNGKINLNAPSEAVITATITPTNTNKYAACSATFIVSAKALMDLSVDVNDVYMFTNDEAPTMPVVNVDAIESGKAIRLIANTDYTYKYSLKTSSGNLTISNDGKTITVDGSSRKYTAGDNVITVTVTPTPSCIAQHHCKVTSFDFTFNVTKAGEKTTPIIDFANEVTLNTNIKDRQLNARISYNGEDITDYFTITYATTDASIITINGNKLSTTAATGTATMTITATPKTEFEQQYAVATKTVNITVKALKTLTVAPETIADKNLTTGDTFQIPELVVKVKENGTLLDRDDYVVTYLSSSPNVATIDKEGIVTAFDEGTSIITIHISDVITDPAKKNYEYTEISFKVNVDDPAVFKVPDAQTDYNIGKVLSTENGNLCVTLGGWIFNKKEFKAEDYGTTKEIFGDDKNQYWGKTPATTGTSSFSPESFKYLIDAGKMKNPRNEFASNCQPQSINVYNAKLEQQPSTLIDPMFNVPTSGSYLIFEPKTNGTVTATIMQNGVFDVTSNKLGYRPQRRVFVLDEAGMLIQSTPKLEVTSGKFDANNKDFTKYPWDLQDTPNASQELVKDHFGIDNFQSDDDNFQNEVRECLINNDIIHNNAVTQGADFKGAKGWSVMVAAPVTYTFNVKAGKTYYLYNFGSRIGLFGFSLRESTPTVDNITYKETQNNVIEATAPGHVAQVSLDRKFAVGKWNAAVLPFSLNKQQVDAIFGQTYDKNHTGGTQILYFEKTEGKYVYYTRHAYNTIVAGKPFLIRPCGTDANGNNVVTKDGDKIVLNTENITAFPYVTIENTRPEKWGRNAETADYHWHSAYNVETVKPNDYYFNSEGVLVMREISNDKIQAFRGFLQKKATAKAKLFSVAYFDLLSDNSDIPSKIEGVMMDSNGELVDIKAGDAVYNLSGQVVTTDASSLYSLPKGIYIVNGKKYVVE